MHPEPLLHLEASRLELMGLGTSANHAPIREALSSELHTILYPEAINTQAFSDRVRVVNGLGGEAQVIAFPV